VTTRDRLRVAIQKSGRLSDPSQALLAQCGLRFRQSRDKLFCYGETLPVDLLLVRDDDIPGLIAQGVCDVGVVGRNVLREQTIAPDSPVSMVQESVALGFGGCHLAIAVPQDDVYNGPSDLAGKRIATSYPNLLANWLRENAVDASVVVLNGSVEIAPRLGTADAICDLVSSGATLAANQLREVATVMQSEAVFATGDRALQDVRGDLLDTLMGRLAGVLAVKDAKILMLNAKRDCVAGITRLLPPRARTTILPLEGPDDLVALQAMCFGALTWQHLEDMKRAGAHDMLVLPVEKMLA
jgi:ATP phosphoribosyltransferase